MSPPLQVVRTDSWVVVPIHSVHRPGQTMEGTRLTLVKVWGGEGGDVAIGRLNLLTPSPPPTPHFQSHTQPDSYEFSIRTPVTPPRWKEFDAELEAAFEALVQALLDGERVWGGVWGDGRVSSRSPSFICRVLCAFRRAPSLASLPATVYLGLPPLILSPPSPGSGDQTRAAPLILTYAYYWYNFMPLARGTAACGYATLLSLFWAAGMPVTASIPKDYQVGSRV